MRHPLFIFEADLNHEMITVKKVHINLDGLTLFIASLKGQEKSEVDIVYRKEIESILKEMNKLEAPATVKEGLKSALAIVNNHLPSCDFTLENFIGFI